MKVRARIRAMQSLISGNSAIWQVRQAKGFPSWENPSHGGLASCWAAADPLPQCLHPGTLTRCLRRRR
jgi:hypothetical protein